MADNSHIEWTDASWNPIRATRKDGWPNKGPGGWACQRVSPGCQHCYAATINKRLGTGFDYDAKGIAGSHVAIDEKALTLPLRWRKPRKVFVCSMTDLFGEWVTDAMLDRIFAVMALTPQHTYQVLTKRPERMQGWMRGFLSEGARETRRFRAALLSVITGQPRSSVRDIEAALARFDWPLPNVWLGVSVEDQEAADKRIPVLLETPAAVRFLSCEPLIGPVDLAAYMADNPAYETNEPDRDIRLRSSEVRSDSDRSGWLGMEGGGGARESVERRDQAGEREASSDRRPRGKGLPHGQGDEEGQASDRGRTSPGVAAFQRPHPAGIDDQPQERGQGRQPAGEPGAGHVLGANSARDARPQDEQGGQPVRGGQSHGQTDGGAGRGDSQPAGIGRKTGTDSSGLRGFVSGGLQDRARRPLGGRDLIIVGGESGSGARPMDVAWARSLVRQCKAAGVAVFVKQLGAKPREHYWDSAGRWPVDMMFADKDVPPVPSPDREPDWWAPVKKNRKGADPQEWPEDLRVREFPR